MQLLLYGDNDFLHELSITLVQLTFRFIYKTSRFAIILHSVT